MKKLVFLLAALGVFALSAYGQKKLPDFSGDWTLDLKASNLSLTPKETKQMNLKVLQTETEITVGYISTNASSGVPLTPKIYNTFGLDGKETTTESAMANVGPSKLTAKIEKSKLILTVKREITTPRGKIISVTRETLELSSDGATLKVTREVDATGMIPAEKLVFHKTPAAN